MEIAPFNQIMRELKVDMYINRNELEIDSEDFYGRLDIGDISNMIEELQTIKDFMKKDILQEGEYLQFLIEAKKHLKNNNK